jgi:hypothetical protein
MSKSIITRGYNAEKEVGLIKQKFPASYASGTPTEPEGDEDENALGRFRVTMINSNRTVVIPAESREDLLAQIIRRNPTITRDQLEDPEQFTIERLPNEG